MKTQVTIDGTGRIVIPKLMRHELGLEPGDTLGVESDGEKIILRPVRRSAALTKEKGVWVLYSGELLSTRLTDGVLRNVRRAKDARNLRTDG